MKYSVETNALAIGYGKTPLLSGIALGVQPGQILTLIGTSSGSSAVPSLQTALFAGLISDFSFLVC